MLDSTIWTGAVQRRCMAVLVVSRYAGTVAVLVDILHAAGIGMIGDLAWDQDGAETIRTALEKFCATPDPSGVLVTAWGPADLTLDLVSSLTSRPRLSIVAVTWHPPDERPQCPLPLMVVEAGRIRRDLAETVHRATRR